MVKLSGRGRKKKLSMAATRFLRRTWLDQARHYPHKNGNTLDPRGLSMMVAQWCFGGALHPLVLETYGVLKARRIHWSIRKT